MDSSIIILIAACVALIVGLNIWSLKARRDPRVSYRKSIRLVRHSNLTAWRKSQKYLGPDVLESTRGRK